MWILGLIGLSGKRLISVDQLNSQLRKYDGDVEKCPSNHKITSIVNT